MFEIMVSNAYPSKQTCIVHFKKAVIPKKKTILEILILAISLDVYVGHEILCAILFIWQHYLWPNKNGMLV